MSKYYKNSSTIGKHHKFDPYLHEKYDIPARKKIKEVLGDLVEDNPDQKQQDLIIKSDTCKYKFLEIQVCASWITKTFPFKNVWVYERKDKYGDDTLFLTLDKFLKRGYLFKAICLKNIKPRRKEKYCREYVYDIPWNQVMPITVEHLDKETIELF